MKSYGERLDEAIDKYGQICVGIDPHPSLLQQWDLPDSAWGVREFSLRVAEAMAGQVAAVKPQSAFFERYGSSGIAVLEETLATLRAQETLAILDVKRGDIGSTMAGYAHAYLGEDAPLRADAITVSPFLGFGSLHPAFDLALSQGRGVYVLAMTSNSQGQQVQLATDGLGRSVSRIMVEEVGTWNNDNCGKTHTGSLGLVVGATMGANVRDQGIDLGAANASILAPGFGAQGGVISQVKSIFGDASRRVLVSTSRAVLGAGPQLEDLRKSIQQIRRELSL